MTENKAAAQLRLAFPRSQAMKAMFSTGDESWSLDLSVQGSPFALPVATGLAVGVPATPITLKALNDCFTAGFSRDGFRELFLRANAIPGASGILTLEQDKRGAWQAKLAETLMPYVLTQEAVKVGEMPPPGTSGLPESLEVCVPEAYRYWLESDPALAAQKRDALVEADFFNEGMLKVVDGDIRLCTQQLYLYEPPSPVVPDAPAGDGLTPDLVAQDGPADLAFMKMLGSFAGPVYTPMEGETPEARDEALRAAALDASGLVLLDTDTEPGLITKALLSAGPQGEWMLAATDSADARAAFEAIGRPFVFKGDVERTLFVASVSPPLTDVVWVSSAPPPDLSTTLGDDLAASVAKRAVTILKATDGTGEEERYVVGVVLEPELVDAQQDIYDEATIKVAAHKFMTDFRTIGLMHKGAVNDKVKILESYITPVDLDFDGSPVKKGAWVMAVRVLDDELWADVKSGALTGFSIGGTALRKPD